MTTVARLSREMLSALYLAGVPSPADTSRKFRMYVDEVGNSDMKASLHNENHRYLSLTGVIVELQYAASVLRPRLEDLKTRYFGSHPDEPLIFHRKELVNQRQPFHALRDPEIKKAFDQELLRLIAELDYVVISAVIDKLMHLTQYRSWQYDPYHYCLAVLLERYALWLDWKGAVGDVMAESRGRREDTRLKTSSAASSALELPTSPMRDLSPASPQAS